MFVCDWFKLAINIKQGKSNKIFVKVLHVVFVFMFFKNFVRRTRAIFVNKENVTVVEITSACLDIGHSPELQTDLSSPYILWFSLKNFNLNSSCKLYLWSNILYHLVIL